VREREERRDGGQLGYRAIIELLCVDWCQSVRSSSSVASLAVLHADISEHSSISTDEETNSHTWQRAVQLGLRRLKCTHLFFQKITIVGLFGLTESASLGSDGRSLCNARMCEALEPQLYRISCIRCLKTT